VLYPSPGLATVLSITDEHVLTRVKGAESHRDPFDRLLLSLAEAESLVLLTADSALLSLGRQEPHLPIRHA
jgi:PIN domain nuclease of toxin-antitoxin system